MKIFLRILPLLTLLPNLTALASTSFCGDYQIKLEKKPSIPDLYFPEEIVLEVIGTSDKNRLLDIKINDLYF